MDQKMAILKWWLAIFILVGAGACNLRLKATRDPFYDAVLIENPKNEAALYGQGQGFIRQGRYEEAEKLFRRLVGVAPKKSGAWLGLGRSLFELHRFEESEIAFQNALYIESGNEAYLGLALATLMSGKVEQARDLSRRIEQKYGSSAVLLKLEGDIEFAAQDYAKALKYYRESYRLEPSQLGMGDHIRDLEEYLGTLGDHSNR